MKPTWTSPTPSVPYREPDVPPVEKRKMPAQMEREELRKLLLMGVVICVFIVGTAVSLAKRFPPHPPSTVTIQSRNCSCTCEVTK